MALVSVVGIFICIWKVSELSSKLEEKSVELESAKRETELARKALRSQAKTKEDGGESHQQVPYSNSALCSPMEEQKQKWNKRKKVVSFSMYSMDGKGTLKAFLKAGVKKNAEMIKVWYPEWVMRIFVSGVSRAAVEELKREAPEAEIVECKLITPVISRNMELRWLSHDDPNVERFVVRDLDSVPGLREMLAVNEWIASGLSFHVMRDHPSHAVPVLGGTWGATRGAFGFKSMEEHLLRTWAPFPTTEVPSNWGEDQGILAGLWADVRHRAISHDGMTNTGCAGAKICKDFPHTTWNHRGFIGLGIKDPGQLEKARWSCFSNCSIIT